MILLKPKRTLPTEGAVIENPTVKDIDTYLPRNRTGLLAFDYETTGLTDSDTPVGVAIVDSFNPSGVYLSFKQCGNAIAQEIVYRIAKRPTIAHNAQFEQQVTKNFIGRYANVQYDTACLLNQIEPDWKTANSDGLKNLQVSLLLWENRGDVELDEWLTANGYIDGRGKVLKGEMHRAPDSILGKYANLDALATWQLYWNVFRPVLDRFPELDVYHTREFQTLITLINDARLSGLTVDREKLLAHKESLELDSTILMDKFFKDSEATPYIEEYNKSIVRAHYDKMPDKLTKTGKPSVRFDKWKIKLAELKQVNHFNPNSKKQLAWLFFDCIFKGTEFTTSVRRDRFGEVVTKVFCNKLKQIRDCKLVLPNGTEITWYTAQELGSTKEPQRKIDKEVLVKLGDAGKLLADYNEIQKELGYVNSMQEKSEGGIHHPKLRVEGTKTGRCAGTGGLNIQQLPKSKGYLDCLVPAEGQVFIQMDVNALEPVVTAELSECPSYLSLYGPNRPANDVYLFVASKIPQFAEAVREAGYDADNPTAEGISAAKKKCKRLRSICKVIHLSAGYGAGAPTIWRNLKEEGIDITLEEVKEIRDMYWKVFKGVKDFERLIKREWTANTGYYLDGLGIPVTLDPYFHKDIVNRCVQGTGHRILVRYLYHLNSLNPVGKPVVVDCHDETVWQCKIEDADKLIEQMNKAWELTNEELGGIIGLYGEPERHNSFAGFKCE